MKKIYKKAFGLEFENLDDLNAFINMQKMNNGKISYYGIFHQFDEESKAKVRNLMNGDNDKFSQAVNAVLRGQDSII